MIKTLLVMALLFSSLACTENTRARRFGGSASIKLQTGHKLVLATWKDNNLWYLTRPMRPEEKPESYTFTENSNWGMLEGAITFLETAR